MTYLGSSRLICAWSRSSICHVFTCGGQTDCRNRLLAVEDHVCLVAECVLPYIHIWWSGAPSLYCYQNLALSATCRYLVAGINRSQSSIMCALARSSDCHISTCDGDTDCRNKLLTVQDHGCLVGEYVRRSQIAGRASGSEVCPAKRLYIACLV